MTAAVCIGVGLLVVAGVWVVVLALCRQAALGDRLLTVRDVAAGQRPHGGVELLGVARGRDGLARVDLDRLDREIARELGCGDRPTREDLLAEAAGALRGYAASFTTSANAGTGARLRELATVVESEAGARR